MRTQEEYHRIVDETIQYYSEDPTRRAINEEGQCRYHTEDGRMCAVGRCMIDPERDAEEETNADSQEDRYFKPEYQGFNKEFWNKLQIIHDINHNWDENGLTPSGERAVGSLMIEINQGRYETNGSN